MSGNSGDMFPFEPSADEIAHTVMQRSGKVIPPNLRDLVDGLIAEGVHDGIEFMEGLIEAGIIYPNEQVLLEAEHQGYMNGLEDAQGFTLREE